MLASPISSASVSSQILLRFLPDCFPHWYKITLELVGKLILLIQVLGARSASSLLW